PGRGAGGAAVGRASGRVERLEEGRRSAGVPEEDLATDATVAGAGDQPGERLRGVDRVDEDALGPGQEAGRVVGRARAGPVGGAALVVAQLDLRGIDSDSGERLET